MKRVRSRGEVEEVREERDAEKWRGQQSSEVSGCFCRLSNMSGISDALWLLAYTFVYRFKVLMKLHRSHKAPVGITECITNL